MDDLFSINISDITDLLNVKVEQFNTVDFIKDDPVLLPHRFRKKQDIEVIGFIVALIAWGKRIMIINNGEKLIEIMGNSPHDYVMNYETGMLSDKAFVHRTFNTEDLDFVLRALKSCYAQHDSLENWFAIKPSETGVKQRIINFRKAFFETPHQQRSEKHFANPEKGSAAKRINMFLRWMVRKDEKGVDFGIWNSIGMDELYVPLDVHTGNVARTLGLITRKQDDWKSLEELMDNLRKMDANDPCKYDFALFGLGVSGEI